MITNVTPTQLRLSSDIQTLDPKLASPFLSLVACVSTAHIGIPKLNTVTFCRLRSWLNHRQLGIPVKSSQIDDILDKHNKRTQTLFPWTYISSFHVAIASVWRPPQATDVANQRPDFSMFPSSSSLLKLRLVTFSFGGGRYTGTSKGWPVVNALPNPRRPWSPRPYCMQTDRQTDKQAERVWEITWRMCLCRRDTSRIELGRLKNFK